jgi:hypothetical protein
MHTACTTHPLRWADCLAAEFAELALLLIAVVLLQAQNILIVQIPVEEAQGCYTGLAR